MNSLKITIACLLILVTCCSYQSFSKSNNQVIEQVMAYSMADIIKRCQKDNGYTDKDMVILEKELKRYLILAILDAGKFGMYSKDVDNLWHSFILFTKNYSDFCNTYSKKFIHHVPKIDSLETPEQATQNRKNFSHFIKKYEEIFTEEIHPIWLIDIGEKNLAIKGT